MVDLAMAFIAGFATCAGIAFALLRSRDDHEPLPPIEEEW
jgi:hypothetical protein